MPYKIPVTKGFSQDQIGSLTIFDDDFKIPFNCVFTLGVKIKPGGLEKVYNKKTKKWEEVITDYEIQTISLIPDSNYQSFLKSDQYIKYKPKKKKLTTV